MQIGPSRDGVSKPTIGVCGVSTIATWGFWSQPAVLVAETYLAAIRRAGGVPVILPSLDAGFSASDLADVVEVVNGVVLTGGSDLSPDLYGQAAGPRTEETVRERDEFELALARAVLGDDVPVLGICRGLQILNVATGGTLHQHLPDEGYGDHRPVPGRLDRVTDHAVVVEPRSLLGDCGLAELRDVNSHHHQGVAQVGAGGRVVARSVPDGAVEAVEWPQHRFALGVQWHPEDPPMHGLFAGLVRSAATALRHEPSSSGSSSSSMSPA